MKVLLVALTFLVASSCACAFEVSEEMINQYVEQKLSEKGNRDIQLLNSKVSLRDGYATFCAIARTRAFPSDVEFCANMTPKWRQDTGSLLATKMVLVSLGAPGVSQKDIELVKMIANQVLLPGLEGIEVYRAEDFIGRQISGVTVMPGKLDLSF